MQALEVALGERSYPIHIGPGLLGDDELLRRGITASQVLIITNEIVAPLYLDALSRSLAAVRPHALVLPDGEGGKTLGTLARIIDELVENGFRRDACLVALGGGVIGDLTGLPRRAISAASLSPRSPPRCLPRSTPRWAARPP